MDNEKRFKIFRAAREKWSEIAQSMVLMEECGELISAVSRYYRGRDTFDHVLEEIADVIVCCEQLILNMADRHDYAFDEFEARIRNIKEEKVNRLNERIG